MAGYIKTHRELLTHRYFKNEKLFKVMMYCLFKATHKEHIALVGRRNIPLKPGQFIFGREVASMELNMAKSTLWDYMKYLENDNFIDIKSDNKYSLVTVVNWASYQVDSDNPDNNPTTNGQQSDTYKKGKNGKKGNKKEYLPDSYEYRISEYLLIKIRERNPEHRQPNLQTWSKEVDKMIRLDNRNVKEIGQVIDFCQSHHFWQNNILSTKKLRDKYDQLKMQMNQPRKVTKVNGINPDTGMHKSRDALLEFVMEADDER